MDPSFESTGVKESSYSADEIWDDFDYVVEYSNQLRQRGKTLNTSVVIPETKKRFLKDGVSETELSQELKGDNGENRVQRLSNPSSIDASPEFDTVRSDLSIDRNPCPVDIRGLTGFETSPHRKEEDKDRRWSFRSDFVTDSKSEYAPGADFVCYQNIQCKDTEIKLKVCNGQESSVLKLPEHKRNVPHIPVNEDHVSIKNKKVNGSFTEVPIRHRANPDMGDSGFSVLTDSKTENNSARTTREPSTSTEQDKEVKGTREDTDGIYCNGRVEGNQSPPSDSEFDVWPDYTDHDKSKAAVDHLETENINAAPVFCDARPRVSYGIDWTFPTAEPITVPPLNIPKMLSLGMDEWLIPTKRGNHPPETLLSICGNVSSSDSDGTDSSEDSFSEVDEPSSQTHTGQKSVTCQEENDSYVNVNIQDKQSRLQASTEESNNGNLSCFETLTTGGFENIDVSKDKNRRVGLQNVFSSVRRGIRSLLEVFRSCCG